MASDKKLYTIDDLVEKASSYITKEEELQKIRDVFDYCKSKHEGQFRQSGEPYYYHPLTTAIILTTVYADCDTICAGLLHDVIEDCGTTKQELEDLYGPTVANLVNGVTKISKIHFSTENEALIEYYKKIIVGMSEDVRVIIIKLADRLHNMRTLWAKTEDKQKKIARETLDILAPIAHHLGIHKIKSELEDLSLRYLKPNVFYDIADKLNNTKLERDKVVNDMITSVSNLLKENNIEHEIKGRSKSIYSIYKKLEKGRKFSDIYDLLALRILVDNVQQCYSIIGMIHAKYKPIPKRFKDYIAMPKVNGYQSLHTTVFGIDGYLFEIQIRTHEMDEVAENGVASHWAYKEHKDLTQTGTNSTEAKLQFFKSIVELNEDKMSSEEFVNSVKNEILNNNIYVFTPKGDIFELPKGSTPIDFAYFIHTRVGETMVGAIVNDSIVPLDYELQDNDIVKINTNKNSPGPSKEWLNIAKTTRAKNRIRTFFTKGEKERYIERGKAEIEKELRKKKLGFNEFFNEENTQEIFKQAKVSDMNDLYLNIGNGKFSGAYVVSLIYKKEESILDKVVFKEIPKHVEGDVIVEGIDKIKVNLANCCNPVPGDEIVGYITKGNGISVHRRCCHNLAFLDNRMVSVSWNPEKTTNKFITSVFIYCKEYDKSLLEIMQKASTSNINIDSMRTNRKLDEIIYDVDIWVRDLDHLNNFIRDLENISYIEKVVRIIK
ncbi:MAG: bifunctional (p)ppGpp synthetase/guanosine-3',5'-bis(diphosphate) 3'-pyrophosphohydrolase [Bacilli bacterium]|nr:bifunctional (p)ppGpp synthetase/guanosine-3',5'-bis(diphosphate) 3'-pyrophosphohydrolase [Bacilli bacterium]